MTRQPAHVLSIPFGVDFVGALSQALFEGPLRSLIDLQGDPLTVATATIYVPTRRAARALADSIARRLGGRAALLPRVAPLGETQALEIRALADEGAADIPPAINDMQRLMVLARLVERWSASVDRDKFKLAESEVFTVASGLAGVISLAGDLARLIDSLHLEAVSLENLKHLDAADFQEMWRLSASFLAIAGESWPAILAERGQIDLSDRHSRLLRAEAERLARQGSAHPIIAAGSTGTIDATAELLKAIAYLPNGAVVLPGLDRNVDARSWSLLEGDAANPSHPQYALRRLLDRIGVTPAEVEEIGAAPPALAARARLLTEAMRPAETTEAWAALADVRDGITAGAEHGLADMAVIEAADERTEALAVALVLREAVETPSTTAALITPDRGLAERVVVELTRWGIAADDSAGMPLSRTPAGRLALILADVMASRLEAHALLALLAHPATHLGLDRATVERGSAAIEIALLRGRLAPTDPGALKKALLAARDETVPYAARARARLGAADFDAALAIIEALAEALAEGVGKLPARAERNAIALPTQARALSGALDRVTRVADGSNALDGPDAQALARLFADLAACGEAAAEITVDALPHALRALMVERSVALPSTGHRRIKIWGLLEARLLSADVVVLGGLVEGKWPARPPTDPFLNRAMRQQLGLGAPERHIGQMAHDFVLACGVARCVLTRPLKADGAETIPSRFLQRLEAVAGEGHWRDAKGRGARYLTLARQLDTPRTRKAVSQPSPIVGAELQPLQLSVTGVETLLRDPYAIFARHVLGLDRLDPLGFAFDARLQGSIWHEALAAFVKANPASLPADAYEDLLRIGCALLAPHMSDPQVGGFTWPRFRRAARWFIEWERKRRRDIESIAVETSSALPLDLTSGAEFCLRARPDRVERRKDGSLAIIDFKTGTPPSLKDIRAGFSPQLTLEAAILRQGGMTDMPRGEVSELLHVKLTGGPEPGKEISVEPGNGFQSLSELADHHLAGLRSLLDSYRSGRRGFTSKPFPAHAPAYSDYDHLARVAEWADEAGPEAEAE
jgi:ATP-dependent helicase/nuclease subunit B